MTRLLMSLLTAVVVGVLAGGPALAASGCGGVVQDPDGVLGADGVAQVDAAADDLAQTATRPLVIVLDSLDGQDPETYLVDVVESCPGLTNADGEWGNNVIAVLLAPADRLTHIEVGADLPDLDVTETNVDLDVMNPRFAEGEYADGLVAGLREMASIHEAAQAVADADDSGDGGGIPWFAGGVGATALLGGGAVAATKARSRRKAIADAHAAAVAAQADRAQAMVDLEAERDRVQLDAKQLADRLGLAEATPLRQAIAAMRGSVDSVVTRWYATTSQIGPTPTGDATTYQQLVEQIDAVGGLVEEATAVLAGLASDVADTVALEAGLDGRLEALGQRHQAIRDAITDAQGRGYRTDPADDDLALSTSALARATEASGERLVAAADEHLDLGESAADDAIEWVEGIEEMRAGLAADLAALRERRGRLLSSIDSALAVMESLEQRFAASAWENVAGNGSEAEAELTSAEAALTASERAQVLDVQDWDEAHNALDAAEQDLDDADALLRAIHERSQELDEAADLAPSTLETAKRAVTEAATFMRSHSRDVSDDVELALDELSRRGEAAQRGLAQDRPDPAAVMAAATQIQSEVAELLATAKQEVTAADAARRRAAKTLGQARTDLSSLLSYARSHRRYVPRRSRSVLDGFEAQLAAIEVVRDPVQQETRAAALSREISQIHADIRREARRARTAAAAPYSIPGGRPRGRGGMGGGMFGTGAGRSRGSSSRGSSSRSRSSGSGSRSRSRGSSSARRSSSGRSRSGRSSRW